MEEKRSPIFAILLIIGILANVFVLAVILRDNAESAVAGAEFKEFDTDVAGFSVTYPAGWKHRTSSGALAYEVRFQCSRNSRVDIFAITRNCITADIYRKDSGTFPTLEECHKEYLRVLMPSIPHIRVTGTSKMLVSGQEAIVATYEGSSEKGLHNKPIKGMLVSAWNSEYYFATRFSAPVKDFEEMQRAFGEFVGTLKLGGYMKDPH